jgi:hypothetical protein
MTMPVRTNEERDAALVSARAVRRVRAQLRDDIRNGQLSACEVLTGYNTNEDWARVKVRWLLESIPGMGQVKVSSLMDQLRIAPSRRVRGLGIHQRAALVDSLKDRNV